MPSLGQLSKCHTCAVLLGHVGDTLSMVPKELSTYFTFMPRANKWHMIAAKPDYPSLNIEAWEDIYCNIEVYTE